MRHLGPCPSHQIEAIVKGAPHTVVQSWLHRDSGKGRLLTALAVVEMRKKCMDR